MTPEFELPQCDEPPFPAPRLDSSRYVEFIELGLRVARENGILEKLIAGRQRPVEEVFVLN
jgi:hypothetical protein